ncbi:glycosyltransferase family 4 protein [Halorubrum trueperi]|uniref:Glycosyltransferase family 4 protein n=1 Tax=Halorubrum trueperi TaxID=2004704 RepID=A0ABD5UG48_9EURY
MIDAEIAIISSHLGHVRGGAEINDLKLGREFERLGSEVTYVTQRDETRSPITIDRPVRIVENRYWYQHSYNLFEPAGKILRHINEEVFRWRIWQEHEEFLRECDLVLTTGRPLLAKLSDDISGTLLYAVRGKVNPLYHRYLRSADGLIFWGGCESEYDDRSILDLPRVMLDPAVDTGSFYPSSVSKKFSSDLRDGDPDTELLTFVGRLEPVKRVDRIIRAVSRLESDYNLKFQVIGAGSQRNDLEILADDQTSGETVKFLGRVPREDIPRYLNASDLFVMASEMENHPIALKEAAMCGTFCVAPDIGRIGEILDDDIGYTYTNNTTEGLTEGLRTVLESEAYRRAPRDQRAKTYNDWQANAEAILELYARIQDGKP